METGPQVRHRAIIADKGYDSDVNRETARKAGAIPVIPYRSNRRNIPKHFAVALYRGRARIEQMMGKLKRFKRVALRCEKTARNFRAIVAIAAVFILIKSVKCRDQTPSTTVALLTLDEFVGRWLGGFSASKTMR
jgi:transposase